MDELTIREATTDDIQAIVVMLADDTLGATRESPDDLAPYLTAFAAIDANPDQILIAAERDRRIVGTAQIAFMAGLSHRGWSVPISKRSACTATSEAPASVAG